VADIYATLSEILDAVAGNITDPPDRRYVANGLPAADCEQLTVHLAGIVRGTTQANRPDFQCAPTTVEAHVTRFWCIPTIDDSGRAPSTSDMETSGHEVSLGALELWQATAAAAAQVACRPAVDEAAPTPPSGGYVGWMVAVRFTI
jgi:hypothetical protein